MSDCIMSISFLVLLLLHLLPCCLALAWKHSPPSSLLLIPLVWCLFSLEFIQDPYLETLHPQPSFCHIHNLFHDVLDWLCCKSCEVMHDIWTQFSPAGIYRFGLNGFHGFFCNIVIFSGVILLDFHDVLSIGDLVHSVGNPFHRVQRVVSLKGPYGPPGLEAELEMLCLGASRPL